MSRLVFKSFSKGVALCEKLLLKKERNEKTSTIAVIYFFNLAVSIIIEK
jgi:hypothetical protein